MKLTCESCNAKYSIADDRIVAGKTFKIRCKKCSHVIIVRGGEAAQTTIVTSGEWHAVIDGQQSGPFDRAELVRRRDAGELDNESLVWREGMSDWAELETLDELRVQPAAPASVDVSDALKLRNERNETSVLFTLGNLVRLASPAQPTPQAKATATATSTPGEEGSGLIDIRALASSWASPSASAKHGAKGAVDDLPVYAPMSLADPMVLVRNRPGVDRRLLVALVAMLAMLLTLATILVIVLTRDGTAQAAVAPAPMPSPPAPLPTPPPATLPAPSPEAAAPTPIAQSSPAPKKRTTTRATPTNPAPTPTPRVFEPPAKEECSDVSCAVSNYAEKCCEQWRLPDNLDRAALAKGIATIKAQKCGNSSSAKGDVNVSVKVTPDGAVSSVTVKSTPDQQLAACVVQEAKRGTFTKTRRGGSFSYFWRF